MAREEVAIEENQQPVTLPDPLAAGNADAHAPKDAEPITTVEAPSSSVAGSSSQGEVTHQPVKRKRHT
jgi:hypothetical protein